MLSVFNKSILFNEGGEFFVIAVLGVDITIRLIGSGHTDH